MMRVSIVFIGCLGWIVGLAPENVLADICCHHCPCALGSNLTTGSAAIVAAPAATSGAGVVNSVPVSAVGPSQDVVQVGPQFMVYAFPPCFNVGLAPQNVEPGITMTAPPSGILEALQLTNAVLIAFTRPAAPLIQAVPAAGNLVSVEQDIRNLQSDVAMLKSRCLSNQGGGTASNVPIPPLEWPTGAAAPSSGSAVEIARLAAQVSELTNAMIAQSKRLDEIAADLRQLKGHPSATGTQSAPLPAPSATPGHPR